jgi:hypothetical protein
VVRLINKCLQERVFPSVTHHGLAVSPHSVPGDADAQPDWPKQTDLQMQAFWEAAEGIRTLDLLHGKQTL